jgi:hypothetical protein
LGTSSPTYRSCGSPGHTSDEKNPGSGTKYNFVVAAAFPAGIAIAAVVIFFALQLPAGGLKIDWWGNNVVGAGCDGGCPLLEIPEIGYFGDAPGSGNFI